MKKMIRLLGLKLLLVRTYIISTLYYTIAIVSFTDAWVGESAWHND